MKRSCVKHIFTTTLSINAICQLVNITACDLYWQKNKPWTYSLTNLFGGIAGKKGTQTAVYDLVPLWWGTFVN